MKLNRYDKVMTFLCVILLPFFIGILIGQKHPQKTPVEPIKTKVDTLIVCDTITLKEPVFVERTRLDSVLVAVKDTIRMRDTLYVYMEREQLVWQDSLSVVYASGILPQVDSVKHFTRDRFITIETQVPVKVRSHWGVGLQAGYGVGSAGITPYVGIGLSYNILSW